MGINYVGPLTVNDLRCKCCEILHTCGEIFSTRGVVLDAATAVVADTFIFILSPFIARPKRLSETNFDGQWLSIYCKENATICSTEKHQMGLQRRRSILGKKFGEFREKLVGSVKRGMKKTTRCSNLSFVEMQTLLYETENNLNSRPLNTSFDDDGE